MYRAAKNTLALIAIAASGFALTACPGKRTDGGSAEVAAVVNGKNIPLGEVERVIKEQTNGQQSALSPLELGAARLQVLDSLIKEEVLYQRAEKEKLMPSDDDIGKVVSEQKQQAGSQETWQKALKEAGQTEDGLRELVRKRLAMQKVLDKVGSKVETPSDKEIEDFYNNNRQRYVTARGVELAVIYVDPQPNAGVTNDAQSDADAQSKANFIAQRLKSGGNFADVAREQSEDAQTAQRGGDIGFFGEEELKRSGFPEDLVSRFFGSMQTGDVTPPIRGSDGRWSLWKLSSKRLQAENLTLDNPQVRQDASNSIISQRKQIMNAALLEVALREAKIENKLAESMLASASSLSSLRPAGAATPPAPAATASPAASGSSTPAAASSPAAGAGKAGDNANNASSKQ